MAITFEEKAKKQRNLILIFGVVILVTSLIVWQGYFSKGTPTEKTTLPLPSRKIEINFEVLKNPLLETLENMEKIEPLEETQIGRENPFSPF